MQVRRRAYLDVQLRLSSANEGPTATTSGYAADIGDRPRPAETLVLMASVFSTKASNPRESDTRPTNNQNRLVPSRPACSNVNVQMPQPAPKHCRRNKTDDDEGPRPDRKSGT